MTDTVREAAAPAVTLDAGATVAEALARLEQAGVEFAVLRDAQGALRGPVTLTDLRRAEGEASLEAIWEETPPPIVVPPGMDVDQVARTVARDLVLNPGFQGVIVREGDRVLGVLPRRLLAQRAARWATRGTADRLEGAPVDILYFECPVDGERRMVPYYDPQNPPTCSQGHPMEPVED
ncbi:MAG: CBS domain-containing protein [Anaerolineae bacterium]